MYTAIKYLLKKREILNDLPLDAHNNHSFRNIHNRQVDIVSHGDIIVDIPRGHKEFQMGESEKKMKRALRKKIDKAYKAFWKRRGLRLDKSRGYMIYGGVYKKPKRFRAGE